MKDYLKDLELTYEEAKNQANVFTPHHIRYDCTLSYHDKSIRFPYQCNPLYSEPNVKDCLTSLFLDAESYQSVRNVDEFLRNFGYADSLESVRMGEKAYKDCEKAFVQLTEVLGDDYDYINDWINNYEEEQEQDLD